MKKPKIGDTKLIKSLKMKVKKMFWLFDKDIIKRRFESDLWLKKLNIKTILDIGANKGEFSQMLHKIFPEAQIYAFEPIKTIFNKLNLEMRNIEKFKAFNFALGEENKTSIISQSFDGGNHSLLQMTPKLTKIFPESAIIEKRERVEIKKLDDVAKNLNLEDNILIKIDVQGYEDRVIIGGKKTISKAKIIIIETSFVNLFNDQSLFDGIYNQLKKIGFEYKGAYKEQILNHEDGSISQQDSIFIKKSMEK